MERPLLSTFVRLQDGQLFIPNRSRFDATIATFPSATYALSLHEARYSKSRQLEKYYWGVCVHQISEETGEDEQVTHDQMKELWLPRRLHSYFGGDICWQCARILKGSTRRLSVDEQLRYVGNVQRFAATSLGIYIPEPNEEMVAA